MVVLGGVHHKVEDPLWKREESSSLVLEKGRKNLPRPWKGKKGRPSPLKREEKGYLAPGMKKRLLPRPCKGKKGVTSPLEWEEKVLPRPCKEK